MPVTTVEGVVKNGKTVIAEGFKLPEDELDLDGNPQSFATVETQVIFADKRFAASSA